MTSRYYKVPIAPGHGAFGPDSGDKSVMGYWLAEFEDQIVVRQLELHPRKPPVMMTTLDNNPDICSFHLDESGLLFKTGLEILAEEFEDEWREAKEVLETTAKENVEETAATLNGEAAPAIQDATLSNDAGDGAEQVESLAQSIADSMVVQQAQAAVTFVSNMSGTCGDASSGGSLDKLARFNELLQLASTELAAVEGENVNMAAVWTQGARVLSALDGIDGFDREHFTRYVYGELMNLAREEVGDSN
eukprot:m.110594 g.110594  ORF g.110594 m.110594 type:complete len:248 (-) comp16982_c1_seq2:229-972(-)